MSEAVLQLSGVVRAYHQGGTTLNVLDGINLTIAPGELVALVGPSGAGKSTLLHVCGLLDKPDSGSVRVAGQDAARLSDGARTKIRNTALGFVYQFHHLLPEFSAVENVAMPLRIANIGRGAAEARATELLGQVGLSHRLTHRPAELSGGEQQRVAIARALANRPRLLLADEPTGNLDTHTSRDVMAVLLSVVRDTGLAGLIATHNLDLAGRLDRVLELRDGQLHSH
jgi:lipoprotein-releasing system ATP-binding protein